MSSIHPFGPTFKKLREIRGLSLKEAAGEIISPQFLSQFEKEQKGMSIENFSRLLISIGLDWQDFISEYKGDRIGCLDDILMEYTKEENNDIISVINRLKKESIPFVRDNREIWIQYVNSIEKMYNKSLSVQNSIDDIDPKILENIKSIPYHYLNEIEQNYALGLIDFLPYKNISKIANECTDMLFKSMDASTLCSNIITLIQIMNYLSNKSYYIECQKLIDKVNEARKYNPLITTNMSLQIEAQEVYNLLQQNKKEGIYKARKVKKAFEALVALENFGPHLVQNKTRFELRVNELNKTGLHLYE